VLFTPTLDRVQLESPGRLAAPNLGPVHLCTGDPFGDSLALYSFFSSSCHCPRTTSWNQTYMKPQPSPGRNGPPGAFLDFRQRSNQPDLERPAMVILRSSHKVGNTNPQARPFSELLSQIGQRSQLAAPKYEDRRSHKSGHVGPSTSTHTCIAFVFLCERKLTRFLPGSVRKSTTSPIILTLLIPSTFVKTIYTTKS
jgi:hypothetical protein